MRWNTVWVLFCWLGISTFGWEAQAQVRNYQKFTREEGLKSNNVYSVFEDSQGYIWFCTDLGVTRFNGFEMEHFRKADGLSDNDVFKITEDSQGRLWFQTFNGKLSFYQDGQFYNESNTNWLQTDLGGRGFITMIQEDSKGRIWLSKSNRGLHCLEGEKWIPVSWDPATKALKVMPGISSLVEISEDRFFAMTMTGVAVLEADKMVLRYTDHPYNNCGRGVFLNGKKAYLNCITSYYQWDSSEAKSLKEIPGHGIQSLANFFTMIPGDGLFVGSYDDGLYQFPSGEIGKGLGKKILDDCSPSGILKDRWGNRWISTLDKGVLFYTRRNWESRLYTTQNGLAANDCFGVQRLPDGQLMIGHSEKAYSVIKDNEVFSNGLASVWLGFGGSKVMDFKVMPDGREFIILENYMTHRINGGRLGAIRVLSRGLYPWYDGSYLVIGRVKLLRWTGKDMEKLRFSYFDDFDEFKVGHLPNDAYSSAMRDGKEVFIGINGGLMRYDTSGMYPVLPDNKWIKEGVGAIEVDAKGRVWLGIQNVGLGLLEGDSVMVLTPEDGLLHETISDIDQDADGDLWIATPHGLNRLKAESIENRDFGFLSYGCADGLPSVNCRQVLIDPDGTLFVTTDKGLVQTSKQILDFPLALPQLFLQSVSIVNKDTLIQDQYDLPWNQNQIGFAFSGQEYRIPEFTKLEYRVEGLDSLWQSATEMKLSFDRLEPGEYQLHARLRGRNDLMSQEKSISFSVLSPFYRKWWFYVVGGVLLLLLLIGIAAFVIHRVRRQARIMVRLARAEQIALQMQMNPHFIFNALNGIKGVYALGDQKRAGRYLSRFSQLLRGVLELSGKEMISLEEELDLITSYLEINQLRFEDQLKFEIKVDPAIKTEQWGIPPLTLQPMVENSIFHGIAPKKEGGTVSIELKKAGNYLDCIVTDDGIGREAASQKKRVRDHTSQATRNTRQRIVFFNQKKDPQDFEIIDLYHEDGTSAGTQVRIRILIREMI